MKVVILAGGKGTRMGDITTNMPKPMVLLNNKPILEHQIELIKRYGLFEIIILIGYKGDVIKKYFGDGGSWGVKISYFSDPKPLGTAGSLKEIEDILSMPFLLLYGDTILDINLIELISFHEKKRGVATLVVHPNDHPHDSDLLDIDVNKKITKFHSKPHRKELYHRNLVNAALYVLSPQIFKYITKNKYLDFGKDVFPYILIKNKSIYGYNTTEYIKDIGTTDRLKEVEKDYITGKVKRLNKSNKQKAIFIDRDGVVNYEDNPLDTHSKFRLLPGVINAIKTINRSDYLAVLVTNQPIIAKGQATKKQVCQIHNYMEYILGKEGVYFDRIYYCPHHPEKGFKNEIKKLKIDCECRKPKTGMVDLAVKEMNIDVKKSFIVGDRTVDIKMGINAYLHTILILQGYAGSDKKYICKPDYTFLDLNEAVNFITFKFQN